MAIFLIVFLLYMLSNSNSGGGLKQLLSELDFEAVKPLLPLFGVNENALDALGGENLQNLLNGNGDILSLIKNLLPVISAVYSAVKGYDLNGSATGGNDFSGFGGAGNSDFGGGYGSAGNSNFGSGYGADYNDLGGGYSNGFSNRSTDCGDGGNGFSGLKSNSFANDFSGSYGRSPQGEPCGLTPVKDLLSPDNFADLEECLQNGE